ncbi:class I SAM-dependent methyltransferase [Novosphingobium sp.]|uniref:class I SAM-dependent methyltransferase n=1 Tax=Novosphingobium sp. TaxID=1874826 RepID=UPI003B53030F
MDDKSQVPIINVHFIDTGHSWNYYNLKRSDFQKTYGNLIGAEPAISGRVIDIGCGHGDNPAYKYFEASVGQLDGVDPFPMIEPAPNLANRWTCGVEELPVGDNTYDMAYSYNVVEHVKEVDPFLRKVVAIIKPGACYWSMSPNYYHPFAKITRTIQASGLLNFYKKLVSSQARQAVNDYPAYYNMSRESNIVSSIKKQKLPITKIDFYYIPNAQWDHYFPPKLRFVARIMDNMWILRRPRKSFIFMFRIEKAA